MLCKQKIHGLLNTVFVLFTIKEDTLGKVNKKKLNFISKLDAEKAYTVG